MIVYLFIYIFELICQCMSVYIVISPCQSRYAMSSHPGWQVCEPIAAIFSITMMASNDIDNIIGVVKSCILV
jgi:hypothetical protein